MQEDRVAIRVSEKTTVNTIFLIETIYF
jgi:hypothetical protein